MCRATCPLLHSPIGGDEVVTTLLIPRHASPRKEHPSFRRFRSEPGIPAGRLGLVSPASGANGVPKPDRVSWTERNGRHATIWLGRSDRSVADVGP